MAVEVISWSITTKAWDRAGIELATPGSVVRLASVARHATDCATWPGILPWTDTKCLDGEFIPHQDRNSTWIGPGPRF